MKHKFPEITRYPLAKPIVKLTELTSFRMWCGHHSDSGGRKQRQGWWVDAGKRERVGTAGSQLALPYPLDAWNKGDLAMALLRFGGDELYWVESSINSPWRRRQRLSSPWGCFLCLLSPFLAWTHTEVICSSGPLSFPYRLPKCILLFSCKSILFQPVLNNFPYKISLITARIGLWGWSMGF